MRRRACALGKACKQAQVWAEVAARVSAAAWASALERVGAQAQAGEHV